MVNNKELDNTKLSVDLESKLAKAASIIEDAGFQIHDANHMYVDFYKDDRLCRFWLKKLWLTGKPVRDGRGFKHLRAQLSNE